MASTLHHGKKKSRKVSTLRREVYLSEQAFLSLLISTIEVSPKETYGVLVGYRQRNRYVIEYAIPYQTAERHASYVYRNERAHEKMVRFLGDLAKVHPIGDFHSHPDTNVSPSDDDKEQMYPTEVYIIIGCSQKTREVPWNYNRDGTLSGTTQEHIIKIRAYYPTDLERGLIRYAPILCPFALGYRKHANGFID
jgi:proteasome lid subunit RPN8/RPN11